MVKMGGIVFYLCFPLWPHTGGGPLLDSPGMGLRSVTSWVSGIFCILIQACCPSA